ncbi:MAG: capsid protein, partial [Eubacterium sp.]|nr:capsid protein [Eubacterium sp.]
MGLIGKMADKVRNGIRSFLEIQPAPAGTIYINEKLDYESNAIKNKIWYRGQSDELSQLYKSIDVDRTLFWKAVPTPGRAIRKIHTGLPANIIDMLVSIVMSDMNSINVSEKQEEWELIAKDNNFEAVMTKALTQTLVVGDGAFKFTINTMISPYPLIEFISGENIEYIYQHGRISRIIFKTAYQYKHRTYLLEETYVKNGIYSHLYANGNEVPLNSIPMTEGLQESVTWEGDFMMAVPFKIYDSNKWEGRGKSVFDSK